MSMSTALFAVIVLICFAGLSAERNPFSVSYVAGKNHPQLVNTGSVLKGTPTVLQLADLYTRVSGDSPLLAEGELSVVGLDPLAKRSKRPILLELHGGKVSLNDDYTPIVQASSQGPQLRQVLEELRNRGIKADGVTFEEKDHGEAEQWLLQHSAERPVLLLQHLPSSVESATAGNAARRKLKDSAVPLTEFQISQYQIALWTTVGFVLLLGASICAVTQMEVIPDSLLYAKFQSGRTGPRSD